MSTEPSADDVPENTADIVVHSPEVARQLADSLPVTRHPPPKSEPIRLTGKDGSDESARQFHPGRVKKRNQGVQVDLAGESGEEGDAEDEDAGEESDAVRDERQGIDNDPPRARKGRRAGKKLFGLPVDRNARGHDPMDYEQKYPPDPIFEEAQPNARVWRMCVDEFQIFDTDLSEDARDTVDVLLVFAGLFSAVVTAFLIQTADKLEPDYVQLSSSILYEILVVQRAHANRSAVDLDPVISSPDALQFMPSHSQLWINGLWYTSLSLSLITALVAVLAKQWLHQYMAMTSGTPLDRSLLRQYRYEGLQAWKVPLIIGLLPVLMHVSLGLFFVGLIVYLVELYGPFAYVTGAFTLATYTAYFATHFFSAVHPQCPYKTPLSNLLFVVLRRLLPPPERERAPKSIREAEASAVKTRQGNLFPIEVLCWVFENSANATARSIILQSLGGFPSHYHRPLAQRFGRAAPEVDRLHNTLVSVIDSPPENPQDARNAYLMMERLARTTKFVTYPNPYSWSLLPKCPPVPLELVAAIAAIPWDTTQPGSKLSPKDMFLQYVPENPDLRLHPQTWIEIIRLILKRTEQPSEDDVQNASPLMLPVIQLCASSPSILDIYSTEEFHPNIGTRLNPKYLPFEETAVTFERVCQVPAFRKVVSKSLYRIFDAFDEYKPPSYVNDLFYPGLRIMLAIVKYFIHVRTCSTADPLVVSELERLVCQIFSALHKREYHPKEEKDGFYIYTTLKALFEKLPVPNDPADLDSPRSLALDVISAFCQEMSCCGLNIFLFKVPNWEDWFSVKLMKNLLLSCVEDVKDSSNMYRYIWPATQLLDRALFTGVPVAYDLFPECDLLTVLLPYRNLPVVRHALCSYILTSSYWIMGDVNRNHQLLGWLPDPFLPDFTPSISTQRKYLLSDKAIFQVCIIMLSVPEDSSSTFLGAFASPRSKIITFLGRYWAKQHDGLDLTWEECRTMLREAAAEQFWIHRHPVYLDPGRSFVLPDEAKVTEMVDYLVSGITLLDEHIARERYINFLGGLSLSPLY